VKGEGKPLHGLFRSNGEPVASSVSETWGGLGRRGGIEQAAPARVAFFPRNLPGNAVVASDAQAASPILESSRKAVAIPLPERRPASLTGEQVATLENSASSRSRMVSRLGQPLDLMRFVKASVSR
jgi:hypothetical protein